MMNTRERRIQDWARECGYTGPMPKDMTSFCNESTLHIWDDIMAKVKSRNTVEKVSRKLLVHRLKSGMSIHEALPREYAIYHRLKTVTNFKEDTLTRIKEKEAMLRKSQKRIKENKFELERTRASNEELDMKIFLLEEKTTSFAAYRSKIQSKANFVENTVFSNNTPNHTEQMKLSTTLMKYTENNNIDSTEKEKITELLHRHRTAVFNEIFVSENILLRDLWNTIETSENIVSTGIYDEKYNDEKFNLYAKCLEYEIEAKMHDRAIETLQLSLQNLRTCVKNNVLQKYPNMNIDNAIKMLDRQARVAGLVVTNALFKNEITSLSEQLATASQNSKSLPHIKIELQIINDSTNIAIKNISTKAEQVAQKQTTLETTKIELRAALEMLTGINLDYLSPMKENVVSQELNVFRDYPLQYYKQCDIGGKVHHSRNNYLFSQAQTNLLSELNVTPLQTPWELLMTIYTDLQWLYHLTAATKSSPTLFLSDVKPICVTMDFKHNSDNAQKLVNDLKSAKQQLNLTELQLHKKRFQEMLTIWSEMKFGAFIPPDKLFDDENYAKYENEFMRYFNMF